MNGNQERNFLNRSDTCGFGRFKIHWGAFDIVSACTSLRGITYSLNLDTSLDVIQDIWYYLYSSAYR